MNLFRKIGLWAWKRETGVAHMLRRKRMIARLKNNNPSIFSNNCIGGVLAHDLRLQFNSPTVNLYFDPLVEFVTYMEHLSYYMTCEPEEEIRPEYPCPVGVLRGNAAEGGDIPDVRLYFLHYQSFAEAKAKWIERTARIHLDNIFVILEMPTYSEALMERFAMLRYANKVVIVYEDAPEHPLAFKMKSLRKYTPGGTLNYRGWAGCRCIDDFDYVSFLNRGH